MAHSRRQFIAATAAAATTGACSPADGERSYEAAVRDTWRHSRDASQAKPAILEDLVRYATLAPSSHNTQCWKFRIGENAISILPDFARRCPAVDPDDHHLFVSLGCATENLVQAALARGLRAQAATGDDGTVHIVLEPTSPLRLASFEAMPLRQSTRAEYDGRPLAPDELATLERAGTGEGVRVLMLTARETMERVLELVVAGNTAQMGDPAFVRELETWIRFSEAEAVRTGDGLFARSSGNPVAPRWLGQRLFRLFFRPDAENDKYVRQVRSSAGIAVFVSESDDRPHWVAAGRAFQRFALQATALGVRSAHLNQPVEVAALRPELARALGAGAYRPDLVIRFGRGPAMPPSLRRPVADVLGA